jgi:chromosomal replication initiation ATPase DnaA
MLENISPYVYPGIKNNEEYRKTKRFKRDRITKEEILSIVAKNCCVSVSQILSRVRGREVIDARFIFVAVMKREFGHTFEHIGEILDRDHTSIIHALETFTDRYRQYDEYREVADGVFEEIKSKIES